MTVIANKRSVMTFFSCPTDPYSHRCRIVLAEKGVSVDVVAVDPINKPDEVSELNPYGSIPTLIDRDLVLYESRIIMEYLDERFPHPPLMPVYPVARSRSRIMMYRIDRDWYSLLHKIESGDIAVAEQARKDLVQSLVTIAPVFNEMPFFLSEEFSLVDCYLAALLWRLPVLGVELPAAASAIKEYSGRVFERESFQVSLSDAERELMARA